MKKAFPLFLAFVILFSFAACAGKNTVPAGSGKPESSPTDDKDNNRPGPSSQPGNADEPSEPTKESSKVLVAYFSVTGTTKTLAEYAAAALNCDLYEIVPQEAYSDADLDYNDRNSRSTKEMNNEASRPAINGSVSDMENYDIVFIGYPIWWGKAPRIICTFMESYDFSGKTIVPFCTSGGSGIGSSASNLHALVSGSAAWLDGDRLRGSSSRSDIVAWINSLGLDITAG
ncbi:MAG: flavodoxin [Clostridia bacterium]